MIFIKFYEKKIPTFEQKFTGKHQEISFISCLEIIYKTFKCEKVKILNLFIKFKN